MRQTTRSVQARRLAILVVSILACGSAQERDVKLGLQAANSFIVDRPSEGTMTATDDRSGGVASVSVLIKPPFTTTPDTKVKFSVTAPSSTRKAIVTPTRVTFPEPLTLSMNLTYEGPTNDRAIATRDSGDCTRNTQTQGSGTYTCTVTSADVQAGPDGQPSMLLAFDLRGTRWSLNFYVFYSLEGLGQDRITPLLSLPVDGSQIFGGATARMFAAVVYDLTSEDHGQVFLQLLNGGNGSVIARSQGLPVDKGLGSLGTEGGLAILPTDFLDTSFLGPGKIPEDVTDLELKALLTNAAGGKKLAEVTIARYKVNLLPDVQIRFSPQTCQDDFIEKPSLIAGAINPDLSCMQLTVNSPALAPGDEVAVQFEAQLQAIEDAPSSGLTLLRETRIVKAGEPIKWVSPGGRFINFAMRRLYFRVTVVLPTGQRFITYLQEAIGIASASTGALGTYKFGSQPTGSLEQNKPNPVVAVVGWDQGDTEESQDVFRCLAYETNGQRTPANCETKISNTDSLRHYTRSQHDSFTMIPPEGPTSLVVYYQYAYGSRTVKSQELYFNIAQFVRLAPGAIVQASGATLQVASNTSGVESVTATTAATGIASLSFVEVAAEPTLPGVQRSRLAVPAAADNTLPAALADGWIGINRIWRIDPSIPKNGSFRSSLTLQFAPSDLPNDPNMDASKLEIVAYDPATGSMERIPTTIDAVAGTATGQIDGLAPVYTLAVFSPFTKKGLAAGAVSAGGRSSRITLVNLDNSTATVNLNLPSKSTKDVGPNQALATTAGELAGNPAGGLDWLLASGPASMAGAYKIDRGSKSSGFDFLETAASPLTNAVIPEVVSSELVSTTLQIANPNPFPARATVSLYTGTGALVGNAPVAVEPSAGLNLSLESNFPNLTKPFAGYAVIRSDQSLYSSAIFEATSDTGAIAAINALQPGSLPSRAAIPVAGVDATGAVSIVNTGSADLRFLATLYAENGAVAQGFTSASVTLLPGEQYLARLTDMFRGGDLPNTGSIVIERTAGEGAGTLLIAGALMSKLAVLPIDRSAQSRLVIPLPDATMPAAIQLFSSGAAASAVVTSLQENGTVLSSTRVAIPARGSNSTQVAAAGTRTYVRIESDQPVNAVALVRANPGNTDIGVLPAQPVPASAANPGGGTGNPTPSLSIPSDVVDFGRVNIGASSDVRSIAVSNASRTTQYRVTSMISSSAQFVLAAGSSLPAPGPGAAQNLMLRFTPTAADTQNATITLATDDPAAPTLTLRVTGFGVAPSATPSLSVSTSTVDFGSATVGQTKDVSLQISNTGTAGLNVTATVTGAAFSRVTTASFTIPPGGASQTVTLRYSPATAGTAAGTLTLTSNDPQRSSLNIPLSGTGISAPAAAAFCNGSFEQPGHSSSYITLSVGGNLPCWNITAGNVDVIGPYWVSSDGRFSLDMDGDAPGTITQTFATVVGTTYTVAFDLAGNPGGGATVKQLEVSAAGQRVTKTFSVAGRSVSSMGWQRETFQFTANSTATVLQFRSLSGASNAGPALDNVCVVAGTAPCGGSTALAAISVSQTSLAFGSVTVLATKDLSLQVSNTGTAALNVNLLVSGTGFSLSTPAAFTIQPGATAQTVTVRYSPFAPIAATGTLTVASNDPARPTISIPMTGTGAAGSSGGGSSVRISVNSAAGWPNGRVSNQLPPLAIDGSTSTYTWTTEAFASARPSYLGIGFAAAASVNRIRLFKDNDSGGAGPVAKDLVIEYTTSPPSTPLASRTWQPVSGLTNGFSGSEMLTATTVNSNGTVAADNHNSLVSGFASLTFNAVNATGIRIGFSNVTTLSQNHYRVYEIEAYSPQ